MTPSKKASIVVLVIQTVAMVTILVLLTLVIYTKANEQAKPDVIEITISKNYQFVSCSNCHTEKRESNDCGKLKHKAWTICIHEHYAFKL